MTALKWTVMLLAFHLMGLFHSKSITAAPVYNTEESQRSGMTDITLVDMNDDDISDAHEITTHNEENDDDDDDDVDGVAEKGKAQISSKEDQEVGNEKESGDSINENTEIPSNTHEDGNIAPFQGTSNEDENEEESNKTSSKEDDNAGYEGAVTEGHVHYESGLAENSGEGEHVNNEEAHDQEVETGVASDDEADTGAAHDDEEDTDAAHEDNEDTETAHEDNEDTGATHYNETDTGAARDDEGDTDAHGEDNEDIDSGEAHDDKEDTGATYEDNEDTGAAQHADEDNGAAHYVEEDTGAAHEDNEDIGAAHEADDIDAGNNTEEHTLTENESEEDYDAEHDNEEDFGTEYVHKENHTAAHEDKEKYTALSPEAFKEESTKTNGTNNKGLAPHMYHEEAAGLVHRVITQHTHGTGNSNESSGDQNAEGRETVDIFNSDVKAMHHLKNDVTYSHIDYKEEEEEEEEGEDDDEEYEGEEEEKDGDNSDYGAKTGNSGVEEDPSGRKLGRKEDKNNDDNSKESDSNTDASDTYGGGSNETLFMAESGGSEDQRLNMERIRQLEESTLKPSTEIKIEHIQPRVKSDVSPGDITASNEDTTTECNCSNHKTDISERREIGHKHGDKNKDKPDATSNDAAKNHGEEEDSVSERTDEYNVTKSVIGFKNSTAVAGLQLQKEEIRRQGVDGINEPGHVSQSQDSEHSQSSTGSFVVLGIIMGTIVVLLGYSVYKSRRRNAREAKFEDFGTEMADVKKTLLPRNEFNGGIHPTIRPEADESNAKLLEDTQYKGNNAKNEETHKVEAGIADCGFQNQEELEGCDDSHPKLEIDFDTIETQSEQNVPDKTLKSHSQEKTNSFPEVASPKKVETADVQSAHHPLETQKTLDNTLKSHSQDSTNHFPEVVITKIVEKADVQRAHHPLKPQKAPDNTFKSRSQGRTYHFPEDVITKKVETAQHPLEPQKAPDNTFKSHSQEGTNSIPEDVITKKVGTADVQSAQHPLEPQKAPENTFKSHSQEGTNSIPEVATPEKVETANVQSAQDSSHQNVHNTANGVSEVVAETPPNVLPQNNYVTANTDGLVMFPAGVQVYTPSMPVTCVRSTITNRPTCGTYTYYRY